MVGALLSFSTMAVSIRELSRAGLTIFEILAVRSGGALLVLLLLLVLRPDLRRYALPRRLRLNCCATSCTTPRNIAWATSLTMLPLALVFALEFTMPAWTVLLAVWLLRERMSASRIGVVVLGLIGVLVILRPGHRQLQSGGLPGAGGGLWLRHHHDHHQEADHVRDHVRHRILDDGHPVPALACWAATRTYSCTCSSAICCR